MGHGVGDLAIGVPGDDEAGAAGAVNVLYGGGSGLTATNDQFWHRAVTGVQGTPVAGDGFGSALAACDFNADGFTDLAIGTPMLGHGGLGEVNVLYGGNGGLSADNDDVVLTADFSGSQTASDNLGSALVAGDFDADGFPDLAIGNPGRNHVGVIFGSQTGLDFNRARQSVDGDDGATGLFGHALAAADFNNDGFIDLTAGAPDDNGQSGSVVVFNGAGAGLAVPGRVWNHP